MKVPQKVKIEFPYIPVIPLLSIYPKDSNGVHNRSTCISMFIAALLMIAKLWNHPRYLPMNNWIKKMWYLHTIQFYSPISMVAGYGGTHLSSQLCRKLRL
jgi:hypothetical protein